MTTIWVVFFYLNDDHDPGGFSKSRMIWVVFSVSQWFGWCLSICTMTMIRMGFFFFKSQQWSVFYYYLNDDHDPGDVFLSQQWSGCVCFSISTMPTIWVHHLPQPWQWSGWCFPISTMATMFGWRVSVWLSNDYREFYGHFPPHVATASMILQGFPVSSMTIILHQIRNRSRMKS